MSLNSSLLELSVSANSSANETTLLDTTATTAIAPSSPLSDPLQSNSSLTSSSLSSDAIPFDSIIPTATNLGVILGRVSHSHSITNGSDYYRLQVSTTSNLSLTLTGLSANTDLRLVRDSNNNGVADSNEILASSTTAGNNSEAINVLGLAAGTYFAHVFQPIHSNTSYTLTLTVDSAGNTISAARNLGSMNGSTMVSDFVGSDDHDDYYRFQLNTTSDLNLSLTGLSADADLHLIQDLNFNGVVDANEVIDYSILEGNSPESIAIQRLGPGSYFIHVGQWSGDTNYTLGISATPSEPGNTLGTAAGLGVLTGQISVNDSVGSTDLQDFYRFHLGTTSDLQLNLTGLLGGDADLYLVRDSNNNGQIDAGEMIGQSRAIGVAPEQISLNNLAAGTYFVAVEQYLGNTNYTLSLTADAAGETLATARNIGILNSSRSFSDFVGDFDSSDYYRFQLNTLSDVSLTLRNLAADADLYLIRDLNSNGIVDKEDLMTASATLGTGTETLTAQNLAAGSYFVWVNQYSGNTNYTLDLLASAVGGFQVLSGTLGADTFTISPNIAQTVISGNGNVDFGSGAQDVIDLSDILSTSVSFNLIGITGTGVAYNLGEGTRMFDAINFSNGRSILFEGIDSIRFADRTINLSITPNDPLFNQQWNLHMMGVHQAWRFTTGSNSVMIAIEDTGVGLDSQGGIHPDLRRNNAFFAGGNHVPDDFFRIDGDLTFLPDSHGTSVQGVIAAASNNGSGLSGINWNSAIVAADVLGGNSGDLSIVQATRDMINVANSQGQRLIINMSFGTRGIDPALEELIASNQNNVLFVISAGNSNTNQLSDPASLAQRYSNVIAVGASWGREDRDGNPKVPGTRISYSGSSGSNYGPGLSLMGPSEVVTLEARRGQSGAFFTYEDNFGGTSAATANVTGVASLVWSANSNLTAAQVHQILAETAYDLGIPGYDTVYGSGFVNADAAVRRAMALAQGQGSLNDSVG